MTIPLLSLSVAVIGDIVQYLSHCITVLPMPVLILSILFMSNGLMVYWPVGYMGRKTQYNTMHASIVWAYRLLNLTL